MAVPLAVAKFTVTGLRAVAESVIGNEKVVVVPAFPSFFEKLKITILHWKRRSCRWFLSPQPLPGFVEVGVVVEVEVDVLVGVVVEVVDVLVEQYWYCDGVVQYW